VEVDPALEMISKLGFVSAGYQMSPPVIEGLKVTWKEPIRSNDAVVVKKYILQKASTGDFETLYEGPLLEFKLPVLNIHSTYKFRICCVTDSGPGDWSESAIVETASQHQWDPKFCSTSIQISPGNLIAEKKVASGSHRVVMGTVPNTSFKFKIVKSSKNGDGICIGMSQRKGVNLEGSNINSVGWHLGCYYGVVYSQQQQGDGQRDYAVNVKAGSVVEVNYYNFDGRGVQMVVSEYSKQYKRIMKKDALVKRGIGFKIDGVDYGVAFPDIPSQETIGDLYPCAHIINQDDVVEILS